MRVAFLGATKGMGRALARLLAERGDRLFLLGRDPDDLERSARDLEARARGRATGACAASGPRPATWRSPRASPPRSRPRRRRWAASTPWW